MNHQPSSGLKLGVVYLGKAAGKHKFTLLDEVDIPLVRTYTFEARVVVDPDGNGAQVLAYCYSTKQGPASGQFVHDMIWESINGKLPPGQCVAHANRISVDNRRANLVQIPRREALSWVRAENFLAGDPEHTLYWVTLSGLPPCPERISCALNMHHNADGDEVEGAEPPVLHECHLSPCCRMEQELRQFRVCGQCRRARYCSEKCQQRDWPLHKQFCLPPVRVADLPDR